MKPIVDSRYDLEDSSILRLARLALLGKWLPLGNFRGGPGARCLAVLLLLHFLGRPLYTIHLRYGHRLQPLLRRLRRS